MKGMEFFNNYGKKANEELLLAYGFCIENNQYDCARLLFSALIKDHEMSEMKKALLDQFEIPASLMDGPDGNKKLTVGPFEVDASGVLPKKLFVASNVLYSDLSEKGEVNCTDICCGVDSEDPCLIGNATAVKDESDNVVFVCPKKPGHRLRCPDKCVEPDAHNAGCSCFGRMDAALGLCQLLEHKFQKLAETQAAFDDSPEGLKKTLVGHYRQGQFNALQAAFEAAEARIDEAEQGGVKCPLQHDTEEPNP